MLCITNRDEPEILRTAMASQERQREQITVPVDAEFWQRLELAAQREHRTVANLVRHIVTQALERQREGAAA
jgi:hypothetical protein